MLLREYLEREGVKDSQYMQTKDAGVGDTEPIEKLMKEKERLDKLLEAYKAQAFPDKREVEALLNKLNEITLKIVYFKDSAGDRVKVTKQDSDKRGRIGIVKEYKGDKPLVKFPDGDEVLFDVGDLEKQGTGDASDDRVEIKKDKVGWDVQVYVNGKSVKTAYGSDKSDALRKASMLAGVYQDDNGQALPIKTIDSDIDLKEYFSTDAPDYYGAIVAIARRADNPKMPRADIRKNLEPIMKVQGVEFNEAEFEKSYKQFSSARMGREYEKSKDSVNTMYDKDFAAGKRDRMIGYYDKWYRYNRNDDGSAYDDGVKAALKDPKCKGECQFISGHPGF